MTGQPISRLDRAATRFMADHPDWGLDLEQARVIVRRTLIGSGYWQAECWRDVWDTLARDVARLLRR